MSDSFTEITTVSWFTRLKNALIGIVIGLVLVVGSVVGIFWNEHRAVQTARSLAQGRGLVIDVDAAKPDPANDGKLVHVAGATSVGALLQDADWGVTATGLRLKRSAEMYQWKEHEHTESSRQMGGGETRSTTYTYEKVWSEDAIDSSRFRQANHGNPPKSVANRDFYARDARLGGFALGTDLLTQLPDGDPLPLGADVAASLKARNANARLADGVIYLGANPAEPAIGDTRISYKLAPAGQLSVVAAQAGTGFSPYQTQAGDPLDMLRPGIQSAAQMFTEAEEENVFLTWALRAALFLAIWLGAFLMMRPLAVFADVIPFIGGLVGFGLGFLSLMVALVVAPVAVAIAWFAFRPFAAIAVLAGGAVLIAGLRALRGRARAAPVAQPAT